MSGGTGEHPLLEVLIAQLFNNGTLSQADLENMDRRLHEGGHEAASGALLGIRLSNMLDTPALRRASLHSIDGGRDSDGGNDTD